MRGSKKRKHPSASSFSAPFSGASTLSNPRVHVRRSCLPRPHPLRQPPPQPALQSENRLDSDGRMFPRLSIKDLRARRVFSPSSPIAISDNKGGDSECSDDVRSLKNAEMDQVSHGSEILETNPNAETPKQVESTVSGELPNAVRNADMCGIEQIRFRDGDLCIQSTVPDEALGKLEADCSWNRKSSVHVSKNLSNGRRNCVSNTKSVLKPFSRLKVFKVPNSLNYKRLLPYLMAVADESSCSQEIEKGSELDPTVQSSGSQCEEILGKKSEADGFPIVYQVNDFVSAEASVSTPIKGSCHNNEPGLVSPKDIVGSQLSLARKSCASKVEQCKPVKAVGNVIPIPETNLSDIPTSTPCHSQTSLVQATSNTSSFRETDLHPETSPVPAHRNMSPIHESTESGEVPNGVRNADMCGIEQIRVLEGGQCIQSTPMLPDDALGKLEAGCSWNRKSTVHVSKNLSNGSSNCVSHTKSVLNPCSRLKMFKVPNLLGYKRLLPYLMAVANEGAQEVEKGSELDPTVQASGSQCEEIVGKKSEADGFPIEYQVNDFVSVEATTPIRGSCHDNEPGLVPPKDITVSQLSLARKSCASQVEQCKPVQAVGNMIPIPETNLPVIPTSTPGHAQTSLVQSTCNVSSFHETDLHPEISLVPAHSNMNPIHETYVHPETSPVQGLSNMSHIHEAYLSTMTKSSCHLGPSGREGNVEVEKRCLTSATNKISTDAPCLGQDCSVAEMAVQLELPSARISTGVLKRNPRCCKGLCTCLSCASFRLDAERAFEFSKHQMQDAEEIALGLIKELSHLRNVLHNSAWSANAILQASEVKKACRKASIAEELAKSRLVEMNDNLNHHCKITFPPDSAWGDQG